MTLPRMIVAFSLAMIAAPAPGDGLAGQATGDLDELGERRAMAYARLPDGLLLVPARAEPKTMQEAAFEQDPMFLYFSGLFDQVGGILLLDGPRREAHLFVPAAVTVFGNRFEDRSVDPGPTSAARLGLDGVHPWEEFISFVERRLEAGTQTIYLEEARRPEFPGVPPDMLPVTGTRDLWERSVKAAFPEASVQPARGTLYDIRWAKLPGEVEELRRNAEATVQAALAAIAAIRPGLRQREVEAAVVHTCLMEGAQGPSFWPWVMSGPNAHIPTVAQSFVDYNHLDRVMRSGELIRLDIGCAGGGYGADVGRTIPVSGRFTEGQRETWNLVIAAYKAGLDAMAPGVSFEAVERASRREVRRLEPGLTTSQARQAAAAVDEWSLLVHGVGIESSEHGPLELREGTVVAFEPMLSVGEDAFFLEDMILITAEGHEILSSGLPYTAEEIEAVMAELRGASHQ